jgi:hypothetical protein
VNGAYKGAGGALGVLGFTRGKRAAKTNLRKDINGLGWIGFLELELYLYPEGGCGVSVDIYIKI